MKVFLTNDLPCIIRNLFDNYIGRHFDRFFQDPLCIKLENTTGYHIYPSLREGAIVYSGGVGGDISFELQLAKKYNAKIFLFDPTPTGINLMKKIKNKNINFYKLGLSGKTGDFHFELLNRVNCGSYSMSQKGGVVLPCISISDFYKKNKHSKIDLLKIDIEGFEYGVIDDILSNDIDIQQIVLEFHGWMKKMPRGLDKIAKRKLKEKGYVQVFKNRNDYTFVKESIKQNFERLRRC